MLRICLPFPVRQIPVRLFPLHSIVFTARYYASCMRGTSHCPVSVSVSVTSRCSTKTAKHRIRITQIKPHDSSRTLVFDAKDLREILLGQPVRERQMQVGWIKIGDFRQITGYRPISKTVKDCEDRSLYKCFKYLLTKLSNNIDVFVIFKWSLTLAIFETIVETTQAIL